MRRVLVVGDVVDDIVVRPLGVVTAASDTNAEIRVHPGGSAANVAAWLGWLGADVAFAGCAGAGASTRHGDALRRHGVDAHVAEVPTSVTATIVLVLDGDGERTMFVDRGANAALSPDQVPAALWDDVGWLHLTGYSFFDDAVRPTALRLLAEARLRRVGISVDPSSVGFLDVCGPRSFLKWTAGCDLLLANEAEGRLLTGEVDAGRAADVLTATYRAVVVTLGARGALARRADGAGWDVEAVETEVVDTTGAGDAFCAGYLAGCQRGDSPQRCLDLGARTAAMAVASVGARPSD